MKKIGIITIHNELHHGAALQAFALCYYLREQGYYAYIIDYRRNLMVKNEYPFPINIAYKIMNYPRYRKFRLFMKKMISSKRYNSINEFQNIEEDYDILCTGSDQVWNPIYSGLNKLNPVYFLDTHSNKYKKISYASSIGAHQFTTEESLLVNQWLDKYSHISVREEFAKNEIKRISSKDREITVVADPTFLLNQNIWSQLSHNHYLPKPYILIYSLDNISLILECARMLKSKTGWQIVRMSNFLSKPQGVDKNIHFCGPQDFLGLIKNANYIITDSFHGTAFSINFRKSFASIAKKDNPYRSKSLLCKAGLDDRLVNSIQEFENLSLNVNYSQIENLESFIVQSKKSLIDFIEK